MASTEPDQDVTPALGAALAAPVQPVRPSLYDLWQQAGGHTSHYDRDRFLDLLREHRHLLRAGDE